MIKHDRIVGNGKHVGIDRIGIITEEFRWSVFSGNRCEHFNVLSPATLTRVFRSLTLFGHFGGETVFVDIVTAFECNFTSEFKRETVSVVKKERN